jgi:hypothetical protein
MPPNLNEAPPPGDIATAWAEEPLVQTEPGEYEPDYDPATYVAHDDPAPATRICKSVSVGTPVCLRRSRFMRWPDDADLRKYAQMMRTSRGPTKFETPAPRRGRK